MIIAGEASGDLHGSALVNKLLIRETELRLVGIGGDKMKEAGTEIVFHIKEMAFLGFAEVVKHLPYIKRVQKRLLEIIEERDIKDLILIDYPGFNLNFAAKAKKLGLKIIYYISPQLWAWGLHRVKKIKRLVDKMLVVFPFEEKFYRQHGVNAEYVGHPLVERIDNFNFAEPNEFKKRIGLGYESEYILLLPGSRKQEIELIFPQIYSAAKEIRNKHKLEIIVACADNLKADIFTDIIDDPKVKVIKGDTYNLMKYAKFGIVKSGTSTLEAALIGMPFLLVYKTGTVTYFIGRKLIKIDTIAMPNIIAGEKIVEELIQDDAVSEKIAETADKYLSNDKKYESLIDNLNKVKNKLSAGNYLASERAAEIIGSLIYEVK